MCCMCSSAPTKSPLRCRRMPAGSLWTMLYIMYNIRIGADSGQQDNKSKELSPYRWQIPLFATPSSPRRAPSSLKCLGVRLDCIEHQLAIRGLEIGLPQQIKNRQRLFIQPLTHGAVFLFIDLLHQLEQSLAGVLDGQSILFGVAAVGIDVRHFDASLELLERLSLIHI